MTASEDSWTREGTIQIGKGSYPDRYIVPGTLYHIGIGGRHEVKGGVLISCIAAIL